MRSVHTGQRPLAPEPGIGARGFSVIQVAILAHSLARFILKFEPLCCFLSLGQEYSPEGTSERLSHRARRRGHWGGR